MPESTPITFKLTVSSQEQLEKLSSHLGHANIEQTVAGAVKSINLGHPVTVVRIIPNRSLSTWFDLAALRLVR